MARRTVYGIGVLAVVGLVTGAAIAIYVLVSGGSGEASAPISAPELVAEEVGGTRFRILPEESEVRFLIDEMLRGQPFTALGRTDQVAGDIVVDTDNPANSQIGTIRINVRTLATDSSFRDRAIRSQILMSSRDEFEFSDFAPTAVGGLPTGVNLGEPVDFTVTGDLTVRDITNQVTFQTRVTAVSIGRLEGIAEATVLRSDYDLTIPSVPNVADVSDEVRLEIEFVAVAIE